MGQGSINSKTANPPKGRTRRSLALTSLQTEWELPGLGQLRLAQSCTNHG